MHSLLGFAYGMITVSISWQLLRDVLKFNRSSRASLLQLNSLGVILLCWCTGLLVNLVQKLRTQLPTSIRWKLSYTVDYVERKPSLTSFTPCFSNPLSRVASTREVTKKCAKVKVLVLPMLGLVVLHTLHPFIIRRKFHCMTRSSRKRLVGWNAA